MNFCKFAQLKLFFRSFRRRALPFLGKKNNFRQTVFIVVGYNPCKCMLRIF